MSKTSRHFNNDNTPAFQQLVTLFFLAFCGFSTTVYGEIQGQPVILKNENYQMEIGITSILVTPAGSPALARKIRPELTLQFTPDNPQYTNGWDQCQVAAWKPDGKAMVMDFWRAAPVTVLNATAVKECGPGAAEIEFGTTTAGTLALAIELKNDGSSPAFIWHLTAKQNGWFSVGFTGLEARKPAQLDFLYQPLLWSWKRFPKSPVLTPESFATTAVVFVTGDGATEGVAPDISEIPYRFASETNSRFGLALRDSAGQARPMLFAPILGGAESKLTTGETRSFKLRYMLQPGDWYAGITYFYHNVAGYHNERQNATCSLNQTLENMISYAMNDTYSGWVKELKGADYSFDAPGTVKNVAASHALSLALTTGNKEIYRRRALPIMEYLLSRERYLYSINDQIQVQSPSHFLHGPAPAIGELAALNQLTGEKNSVFAEETARIFGRPRRLNLGIETAGASWQDYLSYYRIDGDPAKLQKARTLADQYLTEKVWKYPDDFLISAGLKIPSDGFVTEYTPKLYDLLELYEATHDQHYLDGALLGARQMLLWLRSNPMAPTGTVIANAGSLVPGIFPGRRYAQNNNDFKPYDTSTMIPEQRVEAWRTSLVGLPPEAPNTYVYGPVMLAHHAAWLLRLAHLSNDTLLYEAACNAVIGRYANFPGYYFTSLHTTVYQQADYPMHQYLDIKYNAIFYPHIWAHIALLQDFLVSETYYKSKGSINFPSAYAPGYAFLTSKIYGHQPGEIFGNKQVWLWLPPQAIRSEQIGFNHLFGVDQDSTYLVLSNTRHEETSAELSLNPDVLHFNTGTAYPLTFYRPDGSVTNGTMTDGKLHVTVGPESLLAVKIHNLKNLGEDGPLGPSLAGQGIMTRADYFRQESKVAAIGTVTGMILHFGNRADAYFYTDATERQAHKVTLEYQVNNQPEETIEDDSYPYDFSIPLMISGSKLRARLIAEGPGGKTTEVTLPELGGDR